jgi:hypothetical protein
MRVKAENKKAQIEPTDSIWAKLPDISLTTLAVDIVIRVKTFLL